MAIETHDELLEAYEQFFTNFKDDNGDYKYINQINRMIRDGYRSINIDYNDLILIDDIRDLDMASTLMENPFFMLATGSEALSLHVKSENLEYYREVLLDRNHFYVRFHDTPSHIKIRDIRASHVDTLKWLDGIVIRTTEIKSIITRAFYTCTEGHEMEVIFQDGTYFKPDRCNQDTCKAKDFNLDQRRSKLIDWQYITVQEKPEDLPPGASPKSISCRLTDDSVNAVRPGDRVQFGGIVRTKPTKQIKKGQVLTFDTWIDINYIESLTKEDDFLNITPEEEKYFIDISNDPKIHDRIINSIAPSIYGHTEIKEAAMLLLFGGVTKTYPDGFNTRGQPNVLLIGDPGVAKSQMLRYVQSIAPRGIFTSGKGSSAAGLTAAIVRDPDTGEITLEAGALVLADRGICLIDEFDKMNENDRSAIHEAMEQHSYHQSCEIRLKNGKEVSIGKFVDNLFTKYPDRYIEGVNCEILPIEDLEFKIDTTDFTEVLSTKINRISRHKAPDHFYKILFDNGREIIVTPDHPLFVVGDNLVDTIPASSLMINTFVPGPKKITYDENISLVCNYSGGRKNVTLPQSINLDFARFLGYFLAEGYSYKGSSYEIGLSNTNQTIINDMIETIKLVFNVEPIDYTKENRTIRIVSKDIYEYLFTNFPILMKKAIFKRLPSEIFGLSESKRIAFIEAAFEGDGTLESERIGYATASVGLVNDMSDLLLTFGIHTRIVRYKNENIQEENRYYYKLYINGNSLPRFDSYFKIRKYQEEDHYNFLVKRSIEGSVNRETIPTQASIILIKILKRLQITYRGDFYKNIKNQIGVGYERLQPYIDVIERKLVELEEDLKDVMAFDIIRQKHNFSQVRIAELISCSRGNIDYLERGGYSSEKREQLYNKFVSALKQEIMEIRDQLNLIQSFNAFRWSRIVKIDKIPNSGLYKSKWVYDITVLPTQNFISKGIILHNSVSIAKAGIVATLNARTGVFAAANPKFGRYEINRTFNENVDLTAPILSRFDLIFILRDEPEEKNDSIIANHILSLHRFQGSTGDNKPPLEVEVLKKYIAYAKKNYQPALSEEAAELIESFYVSMRTTYGQGSDATKQGNRVSITARQLEGIIRLAEARAKAALRNSVTKQDAQRAIDLVKFSFSQIAIDPETGATDIDALYSGQTGTKRNKLNKLMALIEFLVKQNNGEIMEEELMVEAENEGMGRDYVMGVVTSMKRDGTLYAPKPGVISKP
ncbi:MAG: hypothetical protein INQ03_15120 [Candidatus Heimdallarchaeota archaeon]|nr:hypothetical protein [Candidatus Heimdallarchaeota archaeon]